MIFKYLKEPTEGELFACRDSFKYLEVGMKCCGWMPPAKGSRYYWLYIIWMIWIHVTAEIYLPIMFFLGYAVNFSSFAPDEFLSSVQAFFNVISLTFKVAVVVPNMWRFRQAKDLLDIMDKRCVTLDQKIDVHRCVVRCNYLYLMFQAAYSTYSTINYLSSALTGSTPWVSYNPFVDYRDGPKSLWIAATTEYIIGSGAVYADQMTDVYPVVFGLILRTQLQLLSKRIQKLRTDPDQLDEDSYEELVNCVKDHKILLQYCDIFRPILSRTFFAQLLVIGLGLGLSMLNLLFFARFLTGLATFIFIIVLIIQTFPFCYVCEQIKEDCYNLNLAIFYSNWLGAPRRYKSALLYFLYKAQKSIDFIAGGIFPISMKTNIDFARFAFSVVTIVKQMNFVEKLKIK